MPDPLPPIDYTSRDYAAFRQDMIDAIPTRLPEWTSRSPNDFGITLIELFAYMGDILSFYGDRIANEAFLETATLRSSVLKIAAMLATAQQVPEHLRRSFSSRWLRAQEPRPSLRGPGCQRFRSVEKSPSSSRPWPIS